VKSAATENEQYLNTSSRITGVAVMVVGLIGLADIVLEWRTLGGLVVAALIGLFMMLAYVGLVRPSVTLSPQGLLIRNHLRDHEVPWNQVTDVDVTDVLRVHTPTRRVRSAGVQLIVRDMRKRHVGGRKLKAESSISRSDFVVQRIENHVDRYGEAAQGEVVTRWAVPELAVIGVLAVIAIVAQILS
jgi:hypothetical protein